MASAACRAACSPDAVTYWRLALSICIRPAAGVPDGRTAVHLDAKLRAEMRAEIGQLHFFDPPDRRVDQASGGPVPGVARAQVSMSSCRSQWAAGPAWVRTSVSQYVSSGFQPARTVRAWPTGTAHPAVVR